MNPMMRNITHWAFVVLTLLSKSAPAVHLGPFQSGCPTLDRTLERVKFKSVVMQFLDPHDTGTGHAISRLLWREIREATLSIKGSGTIFAYDKHKLLLQVFQGKDYMKYLNSGYHDATMCIGNVLDFRIVAWGYVLADANWVFIKPLLTLVEKKSNFSPGDINKQARKWLEVNLKSRDPAIVFSAKIPQQRLGFSPLVTQRDSIFERQYKVRCSRTDNCPKGIDLRNTPDNKDESNISGYLPEGSQVQASDMREQWLEIDGPQGKRNYLNIYQAESPPRQIQTRMSNPDFRSTPGKSGERLTWEEIGDWFDVLDIKRVVTLGRNGKLQGNPWYKIKRGATEGWLENDSVRATYTFPVVNFIAGLYFYGSAQDLQDKKGAAEKGAEQFKIFLEQAKDEEPATLAAAHQFRAAALLLSDHTQKDTAILAKALDEAGKAIISTPNDPGTYALRACIYLGPLHDLDKGLADIQKTLELSHTHIAGLALLKQLVQAMSEANRNLFGPGEVNGDTLSLLKTLQARYLPGGKGNYPEDIR